MRIYMSQVPRRIDYIPHTTLQLFCFCHNHTVLTSVFSSVSSLTSQARFKAGAGEEDISLRHYIGAGDEENFSQQIREKYLETRPRPYGPRAGAFAPEWQHPCPSRTECRDARQRCRRWRVVGRLRRGRWRRWRGAPGRTLREREEG